MSCTSTIHQHPLGAPLSPSSDNEVIGNVRVVTMERRRSVKPFRTQDEFLYAMKEDLSEWFNSLYGLSSTAEDLLDHLETGSILCHHAEQVQQYVISSFRCAVDDEVHFKTHQNQNSASERFVSTGIGAKSTDCSVIGSNGTRRPAIHRLGAVDVGDDGCQRLKESGNFCGSSVLEERCCWAGLLSAAARSTPQPGSFHSRDNICQFLAWCRRQLLIPDTLLFETDDLVMRKNERSVVLCLLEAARRAVRSYKFPSAPDLVRLEEEIDDELAREAVKTPATQPPVQRRNVIKVDMMSLDEMVRDILGRCTCPDQFPMVRVSEGRYRIGDSQTMIFVRILRNHVMVRIGGGWDTLENFLNRHDPCRCQLRGHRASALPSSSPTSSVSLNRSFDRSTAASNASGDSVVMSSSASDPQGRGASTGLSSTITVQTSGAWATGSKVADPHVDDRAGLQQRSRPKTPSNEIGSGRQQQQRMRPKTPTAECDVSQKPQQRVRPKTPSFEAKTDQQQVRVRPKTPTGDYGKKSVYPRTPPSSNGRRTPVAMTTIDIDQAEDVHDTSVTKATTSSSVTSRSRPKTPVNLTPRSNATATPITQSTVRDSPMRNPVPRRSMTPEIPDFSHRTDKVTSVSENIETSRGRSAVRTRESAAHTSGSSVRSRNSPRSLSVGRQEMTQMSSEIDGRQQTNRLSSTGSTLRRSGTSGDIRRDVAEAEKENRKNPHVLMISRNAEGRHVIGDYSSGEYSSKTGSNSKQTTPRSQAARNGQPSKQSEEKIQLRQLPVVSTPRVQTTSVTARMSMTADKLLPSKLRVQQPLIQQQSVDGAGNNFKTSEENGLLRSTVDWSVGHTAAAPARSSLRRTLSVGDSFVENVENNVAAVLANGSTDVSNRSKDQDQSTAGITTSSNSRITVIKRSASEATSLMKTDLETADEVDESAKKLEISPNRTALTSVDATDRSRENFSVTDENVASKVSFSDASKSIDSIAAISVTDDCFSNERSRVALQNEINEEPTKNCESFKTLIDSMADIPPPEDDEDINSRMEMLFEEYRKVEMGLMDLVWKANNVEDIRSDSIATSNQKQRGNVGQQNPSRLRSQSKGREPTPADRKSTSSNRSYASVEKRKNDSTLTRTWSGATDGSILSTPRSTGGSVTARTPRSDVVSSTSSTARRRASLHTGDGIQAHFSTVSSLLTPRSTSSSGKMSNTPMTSSANFSERNGHQSVGSGALPANGGSSSAERRSRSCVRNETRGNMTRSKSVTFNDRQDPEGEDRAPGAEEDATGLQRSQGYLDGREVFVKQSVEIPQQIPLQATSIAVTTTNATLERCRRRSYSRASSDDLPPTKIPMPVEVKRQLASMKSHDSCDEGLKRVDSGVDINNMT